MTRRASIVAALAVAALMAGRVPEARAQSQVPNLIITARMNIGALEFGAAVTFLRQALDSASGATRGERVRALVLLCIAELNTNRPDSARAAAQAALALEPRERVDSLDAFHGDLVQIFRDLRPAMPASLEIRGLPPGAQLLVDGVAWAESRRDVPAGMHRIEAGARGYVTVRDSVAVDASLPTIRTITLAPAEPGRLSVSSVPWGQVYLDSELVGETPLFDRALPSGRYAVSIRTGTGAILQQQQVQLQPGRPTNLGTLGGALGLTGESPAFTRPDSLFSALNLDSALRVYRALLRDSVVLPTPELRAHAAVRIGTIHYAMATGRQADADLDSARAAFELAYRLASSVTLDPTETGAELRAFADSVRATVLILGLAVPADTMLPLRGGRLALTATTSHGARVVATIDRGPGGGPSIFSQAVASTQNAVNIEWNLRASDGQIAPDGRYRLQVTAADATGRAAAPEVRVLIIGWERPDTAPVPPPLAPSDLAPETRLLERGPATAMVLGLLIGGATAALPTVAGNTTLNEGMAADVGAYVAAGAAVFTGVMAYVAGHRELTMPENVEANRRARAERESQRTAIAQANARARENLRARVVVEAAP